MGIVITFNVFAPVSSPSEKVTATAVPVLSIITRLAISSELRLWVISNFPNAVKWDKYCNKIATKIVSISDIVTTILVNKENVSKEKIIKIQWIGLVFVMVGLILLA